MFVDIISLESSPGVFSAERLHRLAIDIECGVCIDASLPVLAEQNDRVRLSIVEYHAVPSKESCCVVSQLL